MPYEIVILGGGIAGAAVAHFLTEAGVHSVLLVEREGRPGHHASGRSAEALVEVDPDPIWQQLLLDSLPFLRQPPPAVARMSLVRETGVINLLDERERAAVEASLPELAARGVVAEILEPATCHGDLPFLSERDFAGALRLPRSGRLAVTALLSGYLGAARARGAEVWLNTEVQAVHTLGGRVCGIETSRGPAECRTLVCAAGPWASAIAELAGALPIQLVPLRRTLITVDPPLGMDVTAWPLVSYDSRGIYLVPEGRYLLASPMDEDPIAPCDASPVPAAVQLALDRLGRLAAPLRPPAIRAVRAGLRTFAPDRRPVVGEDPLVPGFFWLAGQGGAGIETSPAVGRLAAQLITRGEIPDPDLARALSPARFAG